LGVTVGSAISDGFKILKCYFRGQSNPVEFTGLLEVVTGGTQIANVAVTLDVQTLLASIVPPVFATTTTGSTGNPALLTIPISEEPKIYSYLIHVAAKDSTNAKFGIWTRRLVAKRISGVVTVLFFDALTDYQIGGLIPATVSHSVSGTDVLIKVQGLLATTLNWRGSWLLENKAP